MKNFLRFMILSRNKSDNFWKGKLLGPIFVMCRGKMETEFIILSESKK